MKKFFYFLLIMMIGQTSYADCIDPFNASPASPYPGYNVSVSRTDRHNLGLFPSRTLLDAALQSFVSGKDGVGGFQNASGTVSSCAYSVRFINYGSNGQGVVFGYYWTTIPTTSACSALEGNFCPTIIDSDGDGIPDDCDAYPNDSTPYKIRSFIYQTEDNTVNGTHTYDNWETNGNPKKDYTTGTKNTNKRTYFQSNAPWQDPPTSCSEPNNYVDPESLPTPIDPPITGDPSDGSAPSNTDPEFKPGTGDATGSETDSGLLGDIKTNTGRAADSLDKMGDYLKDINSGVQNTLRGQIKNRKEDLDRQSKDDAFSDTLKLNAENWNPSSNYPSSKYNGELKEGPDGDYQKPGSLSEESWLSSFVSSNPLVTAFNHSGFQSSGSTCEMTLNLGSLGTHHLSLCEFQSGFAAAGNILLAFCGLTSLIIVVRG